MPEKLVLDVACGLHPRGDVNVDLYIESIHRRNGNGPKLQPDKIQHFIQADGRDMYMFRDREFHTVRCYHLIEHLPDWWRLLKELYRVTDQHLVIVCPHRMWLTFPRLQRSHVHISNFDKPTMEKAIEKVLRTHNYEVQTVYRGMIHKLIPFPLWPCYLRVDVYRS